MGTGTFWVRRAKTHKDFKRNDLRLYLIHEGIDTFFINLKNSILIPKPCFMLMKVLQKFTLNHNEVSNNFYFCSKKCPEIFEKFQNDPESA